MVNFMMKCFLLIIVLFFGVLVGMQQANIGLLQMKGYEDSAFGGAFHLKQTEAGELEASVLGEKVTSLGIEEKREKLEEFKAFNFFSSIGSKIGSLLTTTFQMVIHAVIQTIDSILSYLASL